MARPIARLLPPMLLLLAACGGGAKEASTPSGGSDAAPAAAPAAAPTGKVITIEMITDGTGNFFKPKEVEAAPGDVLRFTLTAGVHNVHFLPDSNASVTGLPPASDLLQLPGQTVDVPVSWKAGTKVYFQCDPHALLGMQGHVTVK